VKKLSRLPLREKSAICGLAGLWALAVAASVALMRARLD